MLRLKKIFSFGRVINDDLYHRVQIMDKNIFSGCNDEFQTNREWWVLLDDKGNIGAYCGSIYTEGICIFIRGWVKKSYRGKGIQKKLISIRLRAAKQKNYKIAITYTTPDNYPSVNNLIGKGFKFYFPEYPYGGKEMLYWSKKV